MTYDKTVLCVEDNIQVQMLNKPLLEARGFAVTLAMTIAEAREAMRQAMPDLMILDIRLPDGSGLDFLSELRKESNVPVIVLTEKKEETDIITGYASGCDDYVSKPYSFSVLYARIERLLRHMSTVPDILEKGALKLDILAGQAFLNGKDLLLTQKEFALLLLFAQNENKTMSAEHLYEKVWKAPMGGDKNIVQVTVSKLRRKIEVAGYGIVLLRGHGYVFEEP